MSLIRMGNRFGRELPLWAVRGALCAGPSLFWAVDMGFDRPAEILGLVAGIALWVVALAWVCAWRSPDGDHFVQLLKLCAWLKAGLGGLSLLVWWLALMAQVAGGLLALPAMVDIFSGIAALWLASCVRGTGSWEVLDQANSFGWSAFATLLDGALVVSLILLSAFALHLLVPRGRDKPEVSPTRSAG